MTRTTSSLILAIVVLCSGIQAQSAPIIMIDPGHGGEDAGVVAGDILEKDVAMSAALALGEAFLAQGYDIRFTRAGDYAVGYAERRAMAEEAGAAMFISVHFNGDDDATLHGIEIYVNLDSEAPSSAGEAVATALRELGGPVAVEGRPWDFLKSPVPSVMIEAGFLTNPEERQLILSADHQHALAEHIAGGANIYLSDEE